MPRWDSHDVCPPGHHGPHGDGPNPYREPCIPPPPKVPREALHVRVGRVVTPGRAVLIMLGAGLAAISVALGPHWWAVPAFVGGFLALAAFIGVATLALDGKDWPWDGGE